jgi:plastocyanin domain-containing protein
MLRVKQRVCYVEVMRATAALLLVLFVGCKREQPAPAPAPAAKPVASVEVKGRRVDVTAGANGFQPSTVTVKQGEPTTVVFTRTTDETCATEVVFPEIKLKKDLPLNQQVAVELPVDTSRTLAFQCGMGMFKSKVVIQ